MDIWKYYVITHRDHVICNPLSLTKLQELVALLDLPAQARVLDIACGKAELLAQLVERYRVSGDAVDLSPYSVRDARKRLLARAPDAPITVHEMDGRSFAAAPASYDLAVCLGASWVFGGHKATLAALRASVRPGGLVLVGEVFWQRPPEQAYLSASGHTATTWGSHAENVTAGVELGLTFLYSVASSTDDWDRYEGLQWRAAERYAQRHPEDADVPELLRRARSKREIYLRWERDGLGWAAYLFIRPVD